MLKKRIAAALVIKNKIVVQSIGFNKFLPVGSPEICVEFLNKWGIDEIILLDIEASNFKKGPDFDLVKRVSKNGFVPLTVGGGIRNISDMQKLVRCGADKISINKVAVENPEIIKEASQIFGNQCIVVCMDIKKNKSGYEVFLNNGTKSTGLDPVIWAKKVESLGAGEILVNSIDKDGKKTGYDLSLIKKISSEVSIPVIAMGGAGKPDHFLQVLNKSGASAAAAGNFFHFQEHSPIIVKSFLLKKGIDIRLDTQADYKEANFDLLGRLAKRPDHYLEKIRFEYQPEEKI